MSKAALSATVQAHILKRVRSQADKILAGRPLIIRDKTGKEIFNPETGFSLEQIRKETNIGQEASVSRGGLKTLAKSFEKLQKQNSLAADAIALLGDDTLFDKLSTYLLEKINKQEKIENIKSRSKAYSYVGLRESEDITTAKLATSKKGEAFKDVVIVNNIAHGKFNEYFIQFLIDKTNASTELVDFIKKNVDTGHLSGVFNIRLQRIFGFKVSQRNRVNYRSMSVTFSDANDELNDLFQKIVLLVSDADYLSSNIKLNLELFSNTTKIIYDKDGNPRVAVETQLSLGNQEIGRKLATTSRHLNQLLAAARTTAVKADAITAGKEMQKFIMSLKPLADEVKNLAELLSKSEVSLPNDVKQVVEDILKDNATIQNLISTEGSDPLIKSIAKTVAHTIAGIPIPPKNISTSKDKLVFSIKNKVQKPKPNIVVGKVKKHSSLNIKPVTGVSYNKPVSLAPLQTLINNSLHDQIRENMGSGDRADILNYRTGRLASSARVERLTQSRQGMITAFYTYMKNPYATFSDGGLQSSPRTRDPKLLISKSIREIGAQVVSNRMRAVLV